MTLREITLKAREIPKLGLEADCITPDNFEGKKLEKLKKLGVFIGNTTDNLENYFDISEREVNGEGGIRIVIEGDVSRVKRIGERMTDGEIIIRGDVGVHLGNEMEGGRIKVNGNVDSYVGTLIKGGRIIIEGNAGNFVGCSHRGDWRGMRDGEIIIKGNVGSNIGECMRGGLIRIGGNANQFVGIRMNGGTIIVNGNTSGRLGAEMKNGMIIVNGIVEEMLPSFVERSEKRDIKINNETMKGRFIEYVGDLAEAGKGLIYVRKNG